MSSAGRPGVWAVGRPEGARLTLILAFGALGIWTVFAFWLFPDVLEAAYRGEGLDLLTAALGGRDQHPVEHYLDRWSAVARDGLATLIAACVVVVFWVSRQMDLERHWFSPGRLDDLAIARIAVVAVQLLLLVWPAIPGCSGCALDDHRLLAQADPVWYQPILAQKILLAPFGWGVRPDADFMAVVKGVGIVSGFLALAGPLGRSSLLVFAWSATVLVGNTYSYAGEYHHSEGLLLIALWALAFSPCYRALAFRYRDRGAAAVGGPTATHPYALWPLRLMQWLLALTYFDAGVAKLLHANLGWFQPTTLAYYLARDGLMSGSQLGVWLSEQAWLLPGLAALTVALELVFFLAILIPRVAPVLVVAMTAVHVSIYVAQSAPFPQHIVLLWVAFLPTLREGWQAWRTY